MSARHEGGVAGPGGPGAVGRPTGGRLSSRSNGFKSPDTLTAALPPVGLDALYGRAEHRGAAPTEKEQRHASRRHYRCRHR